MIKLIIANDKLKMKMKKLQRPNIIYKMFRIKKVVSRQLKLNQSQLFHNQIRCIN